MGEEETRKSKSEYLRKFKMGGELSYCPAVIIGKEFNGVCGPG